MSSVAIFCEKIRKYFCFYFYLSSFLESYFLLFTQVFCFTKYFYFYSSSFESNYFYSSTKKSYSSQHCRHHGPVVWWPVVRASVPCEKQWFKFVFG